MKKEKFLIPIIAASLLCGCAANNNNNNSGTTSTTAESTTNSTQTSAPTAKAVAGINDLSTEKVIWGPGNITDHQQPNDPVLLQRQFSSFNASWLLENEKSVCLTFDEGYENGYTTQILDTLKEKGVKAAFFVTYDYCKNSPDLVQRMIDEGHIVGNHSYTHPSFPDCSAKEVEEEITLLHDYVKDNFNYEMTFFRFPKGEFSEKTLDIVKSLGYTSVFWSFAYADWDVNVQPAAAEAFETITSATHKGAVYLLHAVSKANADCLSDVLDYWANNGYRMGSLEEI